MGANLTKDSIDLGIVAKDPEAMAAFYGGVLGFEERPMMSMPGMRIRPFACGNTVLKIVSMKRQPELNAAPGGLGGATGMRYFTMTVSNLAEIIASAEAAQVTVAVPITEVAPGTTLAIVEDPDGNWVEFVQVA
jgi:catechol 2,3-dioxygenase-like lactoylglutathione lyase family enzyme